MTDLAKYHWLIASVAAHGNHPRMIREALLLYGIHESLGSVDNPVILAWAKEVGVEAEYGHDSIPWCGLFMAVVAKRAGWGNQSPTKPLWAMNWRSFGNIVGKPWLGDVLVFRRDGGGHVGIYVGEDHTNYHVLGGNEADQVNIIPIAIARCVAVRRPPYIVPPNNAKPVLLEPTGEASTDEA